MLDRDLKVLYANSAFAELVGYSQEELLALDRLPLDRLVAANEFDDVQSRITMRVAGDRPAERYTFTMTPRGRDTIEVEVSSAPLVRGGETVGVVAELRDVTTERALQRQIAETADEITDILESAPSVIIKIDERGRIARANSAVRALFGWEPEELEGQNVAILAAGPDRERHGEYLRHYLETGGASTEEGLVFDQPREILAQRKDGSVFPAELLVAEGTPHDGRRTFIGTIVDVTERVEADRRLREVEEQARSVLTASQNPITVWDLDGHPTFANEAALDNLGYTWEEFRELRPADIVHPDDRPELERLRTLALRGERIPHYRRRHITKTGEIRTVQVSALPLTEQPGVLVEWADITDELRYREQLLQAQKSEALGTLVAGVAHDFNNLLTAIRGSIELAREDLPEENRWLNNAQQAAERATELVRQLLQYSRRDAADRAAVDIGAIAHETVALLEETIDRRISIEMQGNIGEARVIGSGGQLQQVVMNLLVNARDAVLERLEDEDHEGYEPRIILRVATQAPGVDGAAERQISIEVEDNGSGMTGDVRERVFDPFFTTKAVGSGTGLGLATVYGIVDDHGGEIDVRSEVGHGTTFIVRLPALADAGLGDSSISAEQADGEGGTTGGLRSRATVLLVDDEPLILEVAQRALEDAGYAVFTAASGTAAIELAALESIDAVILDVNMPSPNGWETLVRLQETHPSLPIVMASGYASEQEALRKGASGLLNKPYRAADLVSAIGRLIEHPAR